MTAPYPAFDGTQPCATGSPERFFPTKVTPAATVAKVRRECTGGRGKPPCPFLAPCRDYALTTLVEGVWGGLTADERAAIRAARGIVAEPLSFGTRSTLGREVEPCGTPAAYARHKRNGEQADRRCLDAHRIYRSRFAS